MTVLADDYRDLTGTYDKLVAIEMIEAVDWREYDTFFEHCRRLLRRRRAHGAAGHRHRDAELRPGQAPHRLHQDRHLPRRLPALDGALTAASNQPGLSTALNDDIGLHYGETLRRWRRNLPTPGDDLDALGLDERFVRLWDFYFSYCEAAFDERYVRDVQLLYTAPAWRPPALRTAPSAEAVHHGWGPELVRT